MSLEIIKTDRYDVPTDEKLRCLAHVKGEELLTAWCAAKKDNIDKVLGLFDNEGKPTGDFTLSATAFNDLYKWTMMPVIRKMESLKGNKITVTFGIDLRDPEMRKAMKSDPALVTRIHDALKSLETRTFDKTLFTSILTGPRKPILIDADITAICDNNGAARTLVDAGGVQELNTRYDQTDEDKAAGRVTISFYKKADIEYEPGEEGGVHFIEATGPWHRVTWLETSMMQCVYEAKLRYDLEKKGIPYGEWLYGALLRCAKSVAYTRMIQAMKPGKMTPALFTGRRTGGMAFLLLQNLFFADHFVQFAPGAVQDGDKTLCLGTSSCDAHYILKKLALGCLNPAGTHAHELSMVSSILYPQMDKNEQHLPLTQVLGHYMYMKLVWEKGGKVGPMPMLPDTLGTRAFLRAANYVTVDGKPFLDKISSARQDSGKLKDFVQNMKDFGYTRGMMASEIDDSSTLLEAANLEFASFGAGGFFGDSEKVWGNKDAASNSMAVKAVRVSYTKGAESYDGIPYIEVVGDTVTGYPVKIGDPKDGRDPRLTGGKLSIDKNKIELVPAIKKYAEDVRVAGGKVGEKPNVRGSISMYALMQQYVRNAAGNVNASFMGGRRTLHRKRRGKAKTRKA